jgi:hypothetical protein
LAILDEVLLPIFRLNTGLHPNQFHHKHNQHNVDLESDIFTVVLNNLGINGQESADNSQRAIGSPQGTADAV